MEKAPIEDYEAAATELNFLRGRLNKLVKNLTRLNERPTAPLLQAREAEKLLNYCSRELELLMKVYYPDSKKRLRDLNGLPEDLEERILEVNLKNKGSY